MRSAILSGAIVGALLSALPSAVHDQATAHPAHSSDVGPVVPSFGTAVTTYHRIGVTEINPEDNGEPYHRDLNFAQL